MMESHLVFLPL